MDWTDIYPEPHARRNVQIPIQGRSGTSSQCPVSRSALTRKFRRLDPFQAEQAMRADDEPNRTLYDPFTCRRLSNKPYR